MALTAIVRYSQRVGSHTVGNASYIIKNSAVIYHGALVGIDPNSGYLQNWNDDSAAIIFAGIAIPRLVPVTLGTAPISVTGNTSASPKVECEVDEGGVILEAIAVTGAVQTSVGKPVYASDENTFTMSATPNVGAIGLIKRFVSASNCDVQLFTPAEYAGVDDAGQV